ncbi:hypothetical protein [Clostridium sp. UBA7339]|uniref:hypothetical protein n=1 Tax=Clostridium sp. UBA7339 TaxID=1946376 RepID=UPI00321777EB
MNGYNTDGNEWRLKIMQISSKELLQYLNISYKILTVAKTELDTERLKDIINAIKNNEYELNNVESEKKVKTKINDEVILDCLVKLKNGFKLNDKEFKIFSEYCSQNIMMKFIVDEEYGKLFEYLSKNKQILKKDLSVIYQYLTSKKTKSIKIDQMIYEIKNHIYKVKNFEDMDENFKQLTKNKKNNIY